MTKTASFPMDALKDLPTSLKLQILNAADNRHVQRLSLSSDSVFVVARSLAGKREFRNDEGIAAGEGTPSTLMEVVSESLEGNGRDDVETGRDKNSFDSNGGDMERKEKTTHVPKASKVCAALREIAIGEAAAAETESSRGRIAVMPLLPSGTVALLSAAETEAERLFASRNSSNAEVLKGGLQGVSSLPVQENSSSPYSCHRDKRGLDASLRDDEIVWLQQMRDLPEAYPSLHRVCECLKQTCSYLELIASEKETDKALVNILADRKIEVQLARFAPGSVGFARHRDALHGGTRLVTIILFLNAGWRAQDGGELRIFLQNQIVDIPPVANRCVVFASQEIEHEVRRLGLRRSRYAITCWCKR